MIKADFDELKYLQAEITGIDINRLITELDNEVNDDYLLEIIIDTVFDCCEWGE